MIAPLDQDGASLLDDFDDDRRLVEATCPDQEHQNRAPGFDRLIPHYDCIGGDPHRVPFARESPEMS